ncbi:MAG: c-type cytochrome [Steroidobacter sp.]
MARRAALVVVFALAASTAAVAEGDAQRGEQVYTRCLACHALAYDRVGPRHCGVIGRRVGSVPEFSYSTAMQQTKFIWTEATLDRFLQKPLKMIPGTTMTYDGVPDAEDRGDLIAYLKQANNSAECAE